MSCHYIWSLPNWRESLCLAPVLKAEDPCGWQNKKKAPLEKAEASLIPFFSIMPFFLYLQLFFL